jgi:hypothetical protein
LPSEISLVAAFAAAQHFSHEARPRLSRHARHTETLQNMRLKVTSSKVVLEPGQVLTIDDGKGVHIRPVGARVWITEEGDCSDFVVNPGEEFVVSHKGRTVIQAIDTTWVDLQEAA